MRKKIRAQRKALSLDFVSAVSDAISKKIIDTPIFQNSVAIGCYAANENEVDLSTVVALADQSKKKMYFPVLHQLNNRFFSFYLADAKTPFSENTLGIFEPEISAKTKIETEKLDLILVPLVAFDAQCHRLGRGVGYYDRSLSFALHKSSQQKPILVGVAYEFQKISAITPESWDVLMDSIMTEKNWYHRPQQ